MDFRCFFKPAGTNPEVDGPYYELSSYVHIVGHFNFETLTLGFEKGARITTMSFRPIDPTKPIVLAVDKQSDIGFIVVDHHLEEGAGAGMRNYVYFKTDAFLIDCNGKPRGGTSSLENDYWSVTSDGMTFVFGDVNFPDTWHLSDADPLCALIAGELTANQLRRHAYLSDREAVKEERREEHIKRLVRENEEAARADGNKLVALAIEYRSMELELSRATNRYHQLVRKLRSTMAGVFPFIGKAKVLQVLEDNN